RRPAAAPDAEAGRDAPRVRPPARRLRRDRARAARVPCRAVARAVRRRSGDRELPVLSTADDDDRDDVCRGRRRPAAHRSGVSELQIEDEVREALRALVEEIGAVSARIVENDDIRTGVPARTLALGGGEYLRVELPTRTDRSKHEHDVEAA